MSYEIRLPEQTKEVEQDTLSVSTGETYTVSKGGTETYTDADIQGTLNVQGTLNLTSTEFDYVERDVLNINPVKAVNRYAREAELNIWDADKDKLPFYEDYQLVDIYHNDELDWGGFVVEQQWDSSEIGVYCLSHDFWLKKETVAREFEETRIADIIETLIKEESNLIYDPELIEVGDNLPISQEYKATLDSVFNDLSEASTGEEYGATNDRRFFFRRQESERGSVEFTQGRYLNTSWDDDSRREINRIVLYYNDGEQSVTAEDKTRQKEIEDKIGGSDGDGVETARVDRPEITDFAAAERAAQTILSQQSPIQVGTIETWNVQDLEPGDVVPVVDSSNDIDDEFVVAEVNHELATAEVLVASNTEGVLDLLSDLSEDVDRVDLKGANVDATDEEIINIEGFNVDIEVSGSADNVEYIDTRLTNIARNAIRTGWRGEANIQITDLAVGTDGSGLSRTNESLENEVTRVAASETLTGSDGVTYSATITQTGVEEVGLFAGTDLIARATLESTNLDGSVSVEISLSDDAEFDRGVATESGIEAMRDVIADNAPKLPTQYAYGSDDTTPTTTDTSLGLQVDVRSIDEVLIDSANTNTEWERVVSEGQ